VTDRAHWTYPSPNRCRTCSAAIIWVRTHAKGKPMPLDAEPVADGNVELTEHGAVVHGQPELAPTGPRYKPHFATCPNWRR
jgi:hypothetical protein